MKCNGFIHNIYLYVNIYIVNIVEFLFGGYIAFAVTSYTSKLRRGRTILRNKQSRAFFYSGLLIVLWHCDSFKNLNL